MASEAIRAAAYLRAAAGEGGSADAALQRQRSRIEQHVSEQGWELVATYEEIPRSDDPGDRPALISMLNDLDQFDKVVISTLLRLRPSPRAALDIFRQLRRAGVDLVSVEDGFDTGAESGAAVPQLLDFAAGWEKNQESRQGWLPENLRKPGFDPATVIDVGVASGTPGLYRAFPNAHVVLIEPLREYLPDLEQLQAELGAEYVLTAVGAKPGTATIEVDREGLIFSSMLPRVPPPAAERLEQREIPVTTLDSLLQERRWRGPFGLKMDVEGFEHHVIAGAPRLLAETQFVIAEVSVKKRFEDSYSFAEFVALMDSLGFRLCDILDLPKVAAFRELRFTNVMFRRNDDRGA
jgi:FkbM family methyltransferase